MSESLQLPEWYPDWAPARRVDRNAEPAAQPPAADQEDYVRSAGDPQVHEAPQSRSAGEDVSQYTLSSSNPPVADNTDGFSRAPPKEIIVTPNRDRMVKRKLKGIHLFMITINATLGTGLYWRGGQILQLGGPLAVLLSFLLVGFLSWAVMQCITELLCIWPVPGALSVYVSEFVDVELGIAVGIAYWFTYSVSFAALIATSAAEFDFWPSFSGNQGIDGGIVYFCIPLVLLLINAFGIEAYGLFEVISGTIKISFLFVIVVFLIAINSGAGPNDKPSLGASLWNKPTEFDGNAANHWFIALLMCISIATFAYVGVEIVAASALEAQWPRRTTQNEAMWNAARSTTLVGTTVKFSSIFISVLATIAYTISSLIASFDIESTNPRLPRLSWTGYIPPEPSDQSTASAFVAIAQQSGIPNLADVFNAFLVFTCLTCANTNLYVASRTLFGLTSRLDGGSGQPWYIQILAWFGRTNNRKVPMRAVVFSAVAFIWVPFLQLRGGTGADTPIGIFIEVLAEMGSVGVLIVWACECVAFIRYYRCIHQHRAALEAQKVSQVRRWSQEEYHDYPYRSHGQPLLAYIALAGCIFVLVVANGAALWNGFHLLPFLSSYLIVVVFLGMWLVLKIVRNARWSFVDLSNPQRVVKKIKDLHDLRLSAS